MKFVAPPPSNDRSERLYCLGSPCLVWPSSSGACPRVVGFGASGAAQDYCRIDRAASPEDLSVTLQILLFMTPGAGALHLGHDDGLYSHHSRPAFLRQALALSRCPQPNYHWISAVLTFFVMSPTIIASMKIPGSPSRPSRSPRSKPWTARPSPSRTLCWPRRPQGSGPVCRHGQNGKTPTPRELPLRIVIPVLLSASCGSVSDRILDLSAVSHH